MKTHVPVMVNEALELLNIKPEGRYIDCTVGTGGHAAAILERLAPEGKLLGIDTDPEAIHAAESSLAIYSSATILVNDNFTNLEEICTRLSFQPVDGILFDLGMSSMQLDDERRGFSFQHNSPLDMRFDPYKKLTAAEIVNTRSESELVSFLWQYGEERNSRRIAKRIVEKRPIRTTNEMVELIEGVVGKKRGKIHPATRTFQALRIAVNKELENLEEALVQAIELLRPGGRLVVISYHSLEDRIVKQFFQRESKGCLCPPEVLECICGHTPSLTLITRKVVATSAAERELNPRSRSAKLRAIERI
jgi:16S rRNA (cytosine1402-N4)-methyltransferase